MKPGIVPISVALLCAVLSAPAATTHYVDLNCSNPTPPYTNWATAATNIQAAVSAAGDGDSVLVSDGTYRIVREIALTNGVMLQSVNGAGVTTIDGGYTTRCVRIAHSNAILSGFSVRHGRATGYANKDGGGIVCRHGTVQECIVADNMAAGWGGGIWCSNGVIQRCVLMCNTGGFAGGAYVRSVGLIRNCLLRENVAGDQGGGVYVSDGGVIESSTLVGNRASLHGGVMLNWGGEVLNSMVLFNEAQQNPNWNAYAGGATGVCRFSRVCSIPAPPGADNLECGGVELLFEDWVSGDYRLMPCSPCLDFGSNQLWMAGATDLAGNPRIDGVAVDPGAHETPIAELRCSLTAPVRAGPEPFLAVFSSYVMGTNTAELYYRWDFDADGEVDREGYGLTVVSNEYSVGTYSPRLDVSNAAGETAFCVRPGYIRAGYPAVYVSPGGSHTYPYTNWSMAATNIHTAVDVGVSGSEVVVADGVYRITRQIVITNGLTLRSLNGATATTILAQTNRCVFLQTNTLLQGFTISGGNAAVGGGIYAVGAVIRECMITKCLSDRGFGWREDDGTDESYGCGGGIHARGCLIEDCTFRDNTAETYCVPGGPGQGGATYYGGFGGGIRAFNSTIRDCGFWGNKGRGDAVSSVDCLVERSFISSDGTSVGLSCTSGRVVSCRIESGRNSLWPVVGGIDCSGGALVENCVIRSNRWGIAMRDSTVRNCLVQDNVGPWHPVGGIDCRDGMIQNCTIIGNVGTNVGGVRLAGTSRVENTICYFNSGAAEPNWLVTSNTSTIAYSCTTPLAEGEGNIDGDPLLDVPFSLPLAGSSCIDAGVGRDWMAGAVDLDGNPRLSGAAPDIGCYEIGPLTVHVSADPSIGIMPFETLLTAHLFGTNTSPAWFLWEAEGDGVWSGAGFDMDQFNCSYVPGLHRPRVLVCTMEESCTGTVEVAVFADTAYVSTNGSHTFPYTNWATAARDVHSALTSCWNGSTIWVSNGTYRIDRELGIDHAITIVGVNGRDAVIVDGMNTTRCARLSHPGAVLEGLTLFHGYGHDGGGVLIDKGCVRRCAIRSNISTNAGGGVRLEDGSVVDSIIANNTAAGATGCGGGIVMVSTQALVSNCLIISNEAPIAGGVSISGYDPGALLKDCAVLNNRSSSSDAGAICAGVDSWYARIENCLIAGNVAESPSWMCIGGVNLYQSTMHNCTVAGNTGRNGGMRTYGGSIHNTIVFGNVSTDNTQVVNWGTTSTFHHCCSSQVLPGTNNVAADPLFANTAAGDYHLQSGSPCIDTGTNIDLAADLDGIPRPLDGNNDGVAIADMGCYEFVHPEADSDKDGLRDTNELAGVTDPTDPDCDADGANDGNEQVAGTDPWDEESVFEVLNPEPEEDGNVVVRWSSEPARTYTLSRSTNLLAGFSILAADIPATPPENAYTDTVFGLEFRAYRVRVHE